MRIISYSVNHTLGIARRIAGYLKKGDIICLFGQLGTGKTVLVKGLALGLGIKKTGVASPSFVLIREYKNSHLPLYHFDLYRLKAPRDIAALGYEEYFYNQGVAVIEWAERLGCLLPKEYLKIELFIKGNTRRLLKFKASGRRYQELLNKIYEPRSSLKAGSEERRAG